jgi:tetratricopeptide (TPR) repeat protein/O-antigen ligase
MASIMKSLNSYTYIYLLLSVFFSAFAHGAVTLDIQALIYISILIFCVIRLLTLFQSNTLKIYGTFTDRSIILLVLYTIVSYLLSYYRYATELYLYQLSACLVLFYFSINEFNEDHKRQRFLLWLVLGGSLFAFFGLVITSGELLGYRIFSKGFYNISLFFVNRNHYAGFLELILPFAFAFALVHKGEKRILFYFISAVIGVAVLFSLSRGGALALAGGMVFFIVMLLRHRKQYLVPFIIMILCMVILALWLGITPLLQRISTLQDPQLAGQGRLIYWTGTVNMITHNPWTGSGLGTFRYVFPRFQPAEVSQLAVTHAHNDYLELAAEMGLIGLFVVLAIIGFLLVRSLNVLSRLSDTKKRIFAIAAVSSFISLLIHSFFEFNIHIFSNALLFTMIMAILVSLVNSVDQDRTHVILKRKSRVAVITIFIICFLIAIYSVGAIFFGNYFYKKSRTFFKIGEYDAAMTAIASAVTCVADNADYHAFAGDIMMQKAYGARDSIKLKYTQFALNHYQKALADCPVSSYFYSKLAFTCQRLGQKEETRKMLEKAITYAPVASFNYYNLGVYYLQQNQVQQALDAFTYFKKLNDRNLVPALNKMFDYHINYERFKDIIDANAVLRLKLAVFLLEKGLDREALTEFAYAYELQPDSTFALRHLRVMQRLGNYQEALDIALVYCHRHPKSLELFQTLAALYEKNDNIEEAIILYHELIKKWPKKIQLYISIARVYATKADYDSAILILKQGLKEVPDRADLYYILSSYLQRENQNEGALMAAKEAVKLKPYSITYHFHLGKLYQAYGLLHEAVDQWEKCLQINSSHQASRNAINAVYEKLNI